jgi:hypothetical protein
VRVVVNLLLPLQKGMQVIDITLRFQENGAVAAVEAAGKDIDCAQELLLAFVK